MRKIVSLSPQEDFQLKLEFDDGTKKEFDMVRYLNFHLTSSLQLQKLLVFSSSSNLKEDSTTYFSDTASATSQYRYNTKANLTMDSLLRLEDVKKLSRNIFLRLC